QIELRDFLGREVKVLTNKRRERAGLRVVQLNSDNLPKGTYFVVMNYSGRIVAKKVVLID
ncbi:MAG: T9SS type A sorting domain-containing protein, partial [Bacteroidota bacterium]